MPPRRRQVPEWDLELKPVRPTRTQRQPPVPGDGLATPLDLDPTLSIAAALAELRRSVDRLGVRLARIEQRLSAQEATATPTRVAPVEEGRAAPLRPRRRPVRPQVPE